MNDLMKAAHSFIEGTEWEAQTPYAVGEVCVLKRL